VDGQQVSLNGYHPGSTVGGGNFSWSNGRHNGGTFIDPLRAWPDWGVPAEVTAWFLDSGIDADCWERVDIDLITPELFGTGTGNDDAIIMKVCLDYCVSIGTAMSIVLPMNQETPMTVQGGATIQYLGGKTNVNAVSTMYNVEYGGRVLDAIIDCRSVLMNAVSLVNVVAWNNTALLGSPPEVTGVIYAIDPLDPAPALVLQGTAITLAALGTGLEPVSLIQYAKIKLDVWGMRDPLLITVDQNLLTDIVYVNSCDISIRSFKCLRPAQLFNSAPLLQIETGLAQIANNTIHVDAQHHTGAYDIIECIGTSNNRINGAAQDWGSNHVNFSTTCINNIVADGGLTRVNDASGRNRNLRDRAINAMCVYDGDIDTLQWESGGVSVIKNAVGSYTFTWDKAFNGTLTYVVSLIASPNSVSLTIPYLFSVTGARTTTSVTISLFRSDTGAAVDLPQINFSVVGQLAP